MSVQLKPAPRGPRDVGEPGGTSATRSGGGLRRAGLAVLLVVLLAAAAGGGWWAARQTVLAPTPQQGGTAVAAQVVVVTEAGVGRSIDLATTASHTSVPLATNMLSGVVTAVDEDLSDVANGAVLYTVGDAPVRVVRGTTPFWRDLGPDAEGPDVRQLQDALREMGYLRTASDGRFTSRTERAVRAWQKALGTDESGLVPLGHLVAAPALDGTLRLGEDIRPGRLLAGGEDAVLGASGERSFEMVVTAEQDQLIPSDATLTVTHEANQWPAVIASREQKEGTVALTLTAPDGGAVCGGQCASLPPGQSLTLRTNVVLVPTVTGPALPASAVRTALDGTAYVQTEDREQVRVTVLAASGGVVVVDGIAVGARVVIGDEAAGESGDGAG